MSAPIHSRVDPVALGLSTIEGGCTVDVNRREQQLNRSRRLLTAQEEERGRLAVELHDELGAPRPRWTA